LIYRVLLLLLPLLPSLLIQTLLSPAERTEFLQTLIPVLAQKVVLVAVPEWVTVPDLPRAALMRPVTEMVLLLLLLLLPSFMTQTLIPVLAVKVVRAAVVF
jgi:hypothetical protein